MPIRHEAVPLGMYDRVLVPTDGSQGTTKTLAHAIEMAQRYDADIHALSVVDDRRLHDLPTERADEAMATMQRRAERAVAEVAMRATESGLEATTVVREGTPAARVLDYAADNAIDVVVMGTHGRGDHERYVRLGSVTQRVVEYADVPVFVIHLPD
jgi:nucleotide-binding universal stress UspA family protein